MNGKPKSKNEKRLQQIVERVAKTNQPVDLQITHYLATEAVRLEMLNRSLHVQVLSAVMGLIKNTGPVPTPSKIQRYFRWSFTHSHEALQMLRGRGFVGLKGELTAAGIDLLENGHFALTQTLCPE